MEKGIVQKSNEEVKNELTKRDEIIHNFRIQVENFEEVVALNDKNSEILSILYESKIIDEKGELIWKLSEIEVNGVVCTLLTFTIMLLKIHRQIMTNQMCICLYFVTILILSLIIACDY